MSNHRQTTAPGPSLVSVIMMAMATLSTIGTGLWITWGATDERHLAGAGLALVLAVVLTAQTMGRAYERVTALERQQARQRRFLDEASHRVRERANDRTVVLGDAGRLVSLGTSPRSAIDNWPQPIQQVGPWEDRHPTQRLTRPILAMPLARREEADEGQYPS